MQTQSGALYSYMAGHSPQLWHAQHPVPAAKHSSLNTAAPCRACPYAIRIMGYIVRKLNAVPSTAAWLAVRLSYGMNGILIPVKNLPSLISYMRCAAVVLGHSRSSHLSTVSA